MNPGDIARSLAKLLRDSTNSPWTEAVLRVRTRADGHVVDAWSDTEPLLTPDQQEMAELFQWLPISIHELRLSRTGEYTYLATPDVDYEATPVVVAQAVDGRWPAWLVFDEDFRYPGYPPLRTPPPERSRPTGAPTDPAVLAHITALTAEFSELYTKIKGHAPIWEPGCTEEQIAEAEAQIGARLPEDLRALYRVTGWTDETGLLGKFAHYPPETVVEYFHDDSFDSVARADDHFGGAVAFESEPDGRVKRLSGNVWWIEVGYDFTEETLAVDLDPAEHGASGQVLVLGGHRDALVRLAAASITEMIEEVLRALRAGEYYRGGDSQESKLLLAQVGFNEDSARSYQAHLYRQEDVAGITTPKQVQELRFIGPGSLNIARLNPLSSLRSLHVHRADSVVADISGLAQLEALDIDAAAVDLAGLTGHETLWKLSLSKVQHPVEIGPLVTLPRLTRLELTGLDVLDLERIGEMASLRVLVLDPHQLRRLMASGGGLPPLAAFQTTDRAALADLVELRRRVLPDGPAPDVTEAAGTLD